jgi:hypothetical protein
MRFLGNCVESVFALAIAFLLADLLGTIWQIHHVFFSFKRIHPVQVSSILGIIEAFTCLFGLAGLGGGICVLLLQTLFARDANSIRLRQIVFLIFGATIIAGPAYTWYIHLPIPRVPLNLFSWAMPALLSFLGACVVLGIQSVFSKWHHSGNDHLSLHIPILNSSTDEAAFLREFEVELSEAVIQSASGGCQGSNSQDAERTILLHGPSVDRMLFEVKPVLEKYSLPVGSYLQIGNSKKMSKIGLS